jgi:hypothetical protein
MGPGQGYQGEGYGDGMGVGDALMAASPPMPGGRAQGREWGEDGDLGEGGEGLGMREFGMGGMGRDYRRTL